MFRIRDILVRILIRICGSLPLINGSGSFSFRQWSSKRHQKIIFFWCFCLLLFEGKFTSFFKDKKSQRSHKTLEIKGFSYYFCLMIEGARSGSVPLTNGSGSGTLLLSMVECVNNRFYSPQKTSPHSVTTVSSPPPPPPSLSLCRTRIASFLQSFTPELPSTLALNSFRLLFTPTMEQPNVSVPSSIIGIRTQRSYSRTIYKPKSQGFCCQLFTVAHFLHFLSLPCFFPKAEIRGDFVCFFFFFLICSMSSLLYTTLTRRIK